MMYSKTARTELLVIITVSSLIILSFVFSVAGEKGPYLEGVWLHKGAVQGQNLYQICTYHRDLAASKVSGTVFCATSGSINRPLPDGSTMTLHEETHGIWDWSPSEGYKFKAAALVTSEGKVIGMAELTGTLVRDGAGKMVGTWTNTFKDLEGNVMMKVPGESEFTRIEMK